MHFFFNVLVLNPETALPVVRTCWAQMTTFCTSYEQHHLLCVKNSFKDKLLYCNIFKSIPENVDWSHIWRSA